MMIESSENPFDGIDLGPGEVEIAGPNAVPGFIVEEPEAYYPEASAPPAQAHINGQMAEAHRRYQKASLYRDLLSGHFFSDSDEISTDVEAELYAFVQWRWAVLLNVAPPPEVSARLTELMGAAVMAEVGGFSATEIKVLKTLAQGALNNVRLRRQVLPGEAPPRPAPPVAGPRRPAPLPARPAPQQPVRRPVATPVQQVPQPPPQPVAPPQPARPPRPAPQQQGGPPNPKAPPPPRDSEIAEGGRKFKVLWRPFEPAIYGPEMEQKFHSMRPGSWATIPSGEQVVREGTEFFRILKQDVTPPVIDLTAPGRVPFPSGKREMEYMSAQTAARQAADREGGLTKGQLVAVSAFINS